MMDVSVLHCSLYCVTANKQQQPVHPFFLSSLTSSVEKEVVCDTFFHVVGREGHLLQKLLFKVMSIANDYAAAC